jgi:hypothetical protein
MLSNLARWLFYGLTIYGAIALATAAYVYPQPPLTMLPQAERIYVAARIGIVWPRFWLALVSSRTSATQRLV